MKLIKRTAVLALVAILLLSFPTAATAAESDKWTFIDGINITRSVNTAIIYRDIVSTGQNQWGHNIVVNADGAVTEIIQGGDTAGSDLAVPQGGMVISAAGTKLQWFKDNIKKGSVVFYDSYSQRLFVCASNGSFDPYFTKETMINGDVGKYFVSDPLLDGTPQYTYSVAVNAEGIVVARGSAVTAPEGGFTVSAGTKSGLSFLVMYAPVGAKCVAEGGKAIFSYDNTMLGRTLSLLLDSAKASVENAKEAYYDFNTAKAEEIIASAEAVINSHPDAKTVLNLAYSLETELKSAVADRNISELRGAFHTPVETSTGAVRKVIGSAKAAGLNTIILRLSNGYGSFIPLSSENKFKQDEKFAGFDVLAAYIELCKEMDIGLTLCVDVYYNEYASIAAAEWLSESNKGTGGIADKYFSPANGEFEDYYISYIDYIISRYDIRSLMFDSLRYPKFSENGDIGYDNNTLTLFSQQYKVPIAEAEKLKTDLFTSKNWKNWVEFKTKLIDNMAARISETVRTKRPDITITAIAARDRVDHYYMQNATGWIENGLFDGLCVALYNGYAEESDPIPELAYNSGFIAEKSAMYSAYTGEKAYFFAGLESDSAIGAEHISNAVVSLRNLGANGFVFGSLSGYIAQHYDSFLKEGVFAKEAFSPLGEPAETMKAVLEYSKSKIGDTLVSLGGCSEATAALAGEKINEAIKLLNGGALSRDQAKKLENDIAVQFADSPAKESALKELKTVTKLASLAKTEPAEIIPPDDNESNPGDTSSESSIPDESEALNESESDSATPPLYPIEEEPKVEIGVVLIYCFVGIALAAAIAGTVAAIKRGRNKPVNRHLPKAALEKQEQNDENGE